MVGENCLEFAYAIRIENCNVLGKIYDMSERGFEMMELFIYRMFLCVVPGSGHSMSQQNIPCGLSLSLL